MDNSHNVITSPKLDPWVKILLSSDNQDEFCLFNLQNGHYLSILNSAITQATSCSASNLITLDTINPATTDGTFKLRSFNF